MSRYHVMSSVAPPVAAGAPLSVFPRASAQVAKETLAIIGLVLAAVVLGMLVVVVVPELFSRAAHAVACSTLERWSLFSPWCSALI